MSMIDALEPRRLFAATSTFRNGILRINGTDESEVFAVTYIPASQKLDPDSGTNVIRASDPAPAGLDMVVSVDGKAVVRVNTRNIRGLNIFANGGNDTVSTPSGFILTQDADGNFVPIGPRLYVEGGSGNDRITGGGSNDRLYGGRGNDVIVDVGASNYVSGGAGDDVINVLEANSLRVGRAGGVITGGDPVTEGNPDSVNGGAGDDTVYANVDDLLHDVEQNAGPIFRLRHA